MARRRIGYPAVITEVERAARHLGRVGMAVVRRQGAKGQRLALGAKLPERASGESDDSAAMTGEPGM